VCVDFYTQLPAYEDGTECSETSAYKLQTPGNHPEVSIQVFICIGITQRTWESGCWRLQQLWWKQH